MSHFIYKTTKLILLFSYVLNVFSECELFVNVDPKHLKQLVLGNFELNILSSFIFPTAKFMLSYFMVFKVSLFWQNQWLTPSSSLFISVASRFPILMRLVSSANSTISASFPHISGRSLIYRRNKKGPSTEPWGTPVFISWSLEFRSSFSTYWHRLLK